MRWRARFSAVSVVPLTNRIRQKTASAPKNRKAAMLWIQLARPSPSRHWIRVMGMVLQAAAGSVAMMAVALGRVGRV